MAVVVTRNVRVGLRIALNLWLAAGLLHLALPRSDIQPLAAAAIILVRQLVGAALRRSPSRPGPGSGARAELSG